MKTIYKYFNYHSLVIMISILSLSCEDFVTVDAPNYEITGELLFTDASSVDAALTDIYSQLRDNILTTGNILGVGYLMGLYTDELVNYNPNAAALLFYENTVLPNNNSVLNFWSGGYNLIYATNSIIEGVTASHAFSIEEKNTYLGEAYFLRGFIHFYLVNLFGDIPYIRTTDYEKNQSIPKLNQDVVYSEIILDLQESKSFLEELPMGDSNFRINQLVSSAFLSRVYLYQHLWEEALNEADYVINSGHYQLQSDIDQVFSNLSPETIWQFDTGRAGANTLDAQTYVFVSGPPPNSALSEAFISKMEPQDFRFTQWIGQVTNGSETWFFPNKYKFNSLTDTTQECSIIFRLAELYLIRAEAYAQLGQIPNALNDLNRIRDRAHLSPITSIDSDTVLNAIYEERRFELFTEMGHRFLDLKRTGLIHNTLENVKPNWKPTMDRLPIPDSELILNPSLNPQNDGY